MSLKFFLTSVELVYLMFNIWSRYPEGTGFWTPEATGHSLGVVASIVLVSSGLDCPGVSLAEVCATCLRCHLW